jgi:hypothetical protein
MRKLREQRNALDHPIEGRGEVPTGFCKQIKLAVADRHPRAVAKHLTDRQRLAVPLLGGGILALEIPGGRSLPT